MKDLISRNDIAIMRKLRDAINKEFDEDFKISDPDFIEKIYSYILDSVNEGLYDEFCKLDTVAPVEKKEEKPASKAKKFYRGNPVD